MGNRKGRNLLATMLFFYLLAPVAKAADCNEKELSLTMSVLEKASRVERASQQLKVEMNGKPTSFPLTVGNALKNASLVVTGRPVQINSEAGYCWFEITLKNSVGKTLSYGTSTVRGSKFSFGTGFQDPTDPRHELVLVIDSTRPLEK